MLRDKVVKLLTSSKLGEFDLVIEPNKTTADFMLELLKFRELFYFMAWRDILVRYKQTVIGVAWSVIRPLLHRRLERERTLLRSCRCCRERSRLLLRE